MRRVPSGLRMHWNDYITSTTRSPVTRNTNHMLHKSSHNTKLDHAVSIPIPPPKDRIKWWNIVPGDKVRIRGDKTSTLQEVYSVNKIANHVFLRGIRVSEKHQDLKPFNYSHLQLFVDHFEFPPKPGSDKPQIVPVFVRRWKMTTPRWNGDHLHWTRYAVATDPSLPGWDKTEPLEVPWPANTEQPPTYQVTSNEVLDEEAKRTTYVPPRPDVALSDAMPDLYLKSFAAPETYDPSLPVEFFLADELSNPHSRTKKQERWQLKQASVKQLREQMLASELAEANADGRSRKEARAEAAWKIARTLREMKKAEGIRRAIQRGVHARVERRKVRRQRKEEARIRRLRETVLFEEPNQVLPGTSDIAQRYV
ncbi:hypothetical protein EXIGLDRAFT_835312 [Exidia glandulosa HHB12029]|uniref:KOW domain-containing protein n=1 Tax=Exidia glandulosa HHB12029 TaxID=1314781 RepID=A0A165IX58_EXIGL|nr:hypothetical protein EXIGLDRAFT_835312 [Exidia glandulosa HHB12029]